MKRLLTLTFCLFTLVGFIKADNDKFIKTEKLPKKAIEFIKQHFPKDKISFVKIGTDLLQKSYKAVLANGASVEFDKKGEWEEIECKNTAVPNDIIPKEIRTQLSKKFPDAKVVKIERDSKGYDVELDNDMDLKYTNKFKLIEVDN